MTYAAARSPVAALYLLRIEVDAHCRGGEPIKPWAALIRGPSIKFGLEREFIRPMNDWREAHRSWRGNVYGKVATFPLREGHLYEVMQARGKSSKRHTSREFYWVEGGKMHRRSVEEALAIADDDDRPAVDFRVSESREAPALVARVDGLGTPAPKAFVIEDDVRHYRLHEGDVYEVRGTGARGVTFGPFVGVAGGKFQNLTREEAAAWLRW